MRSTYPAYMKTRSSARVASPVFVSYHMLRALSTGPAVKHSDGRGSKRAAIHRRGTGHGCVHRKNKTQARKIITTSKLVVMIDTVRIPSLRRRFPGTG